MKKLSEAEFKVMKILWNNNSPLSTNQIIPQFDDDTNWMPQTVLTLLIRMYNKGFVESERRGKERTFYPLVKKEEYVQEETSTFMKRFHKNSVVTMVNTLYEGESLSQEDLDDLRRYLDEKR